MMKRLIIFCFLIFALLLGLKNSVSAQFPQEDVKLQVEVDHVANIGEKFGEKVTLLFKFSKKDKLNYQRFLLEKRLAELKYIIDSKEWQPVEEVSSRYATYVGKFGAFVAKSDLNDQKKGILDMYERHSVVLEELQKNFEFESGWWLLIQHDINSIKIFSGQIK